MNDDEQAVIVAGNFDSGASFGTKEEKRQLNHLRSMLREVSDDIGAECEGHELGDGGFAIYLYGDSTDEIFEAIEPVLEQSPFTHLDITKQYGSPQDENTQATMTVSEMGAHGVRIEALLALAREKGFKIKNIVMEDQSFWLSGGRTKDNHMFIIRISPQKTISSFQFDGFVFRLDEGFTQDELLDTAHVLIKTPVKTELIRIHKWNPIFLVNKEKTTWTFPDDTTLTFEVREGQDKMIKPSPELLGLITSPQKAL